MQIKFPIENIIANGTGSPSINVLNAKNEKNDKK